jgi:hypothetical protein
MAVRRRLFFPDVPTRLASVERAVHWLIVLRIVDAVAVLGVLLYLAFR